MTLADILIPLAGSISNEKALKMREACDALEAQIDVAQRGMTNAHDLISLLTDRVKELERDNLDRRLTSLERAVDVLDRERVETLNLRVNGLETTVLELRDAMKNIAVATDETLRAVRLNTGEGSTEGRASCHHGDAVRMGTKDAEQSPGTAAGIESGPSPASSVPAPATGEVLRYCYDEMGSFARIGRSDGSFVAFVKNEEGARLVVEELNAIASRAPAAPVHALSEALNALEYVMRAHPEITGQAQRAHTVDLVRAALKGAQSAPVVDVRRLLVDFFACFPGDVRSGDMNMRAMTSALAAQGVRTKDGAP